MPILQSRFIRVLTFARNMISGHRALGDSFVYLRKEKDIITKANSAIEHEKDPVIRNVLEELKASFLILEMTYTAMEPNANEVTNIVEELAHFKATQKRNELAAKYQQKKRLQAEQEVAYLPTASGKYSPRDWAPGEYEKIEQEVRAKFWPEATPSPQFSANPVTQQEEVYTILGNNEVASTTDRAPEGREGRRHGIAGSTIQTSSYSEPEATAPMPAVPAEASPSPPISSAQAEPSVAPSLVARKRADGTIAYLPPDDELNKPPTLGPKLF